MRTKKALITGIAGQDGSYLAELLLSKGYEVHGIDLPIIPNEKKVKLANIVHIMDRIHLHFYSLLDIDAVSGLIKSIKPDECYHLAASSFVSFEYKDESSILTNNIMSTHGLLGALRKYAPRCRFFFAGSSEMFGDVAGTPQNENTPFNPRSIYGISKVAGHNLVNYYRKQYGMHLSTGILYNHESPRRPLQFVTRKISSAVAGIRHGLKDKVHLGNLDTLRDWGYAPDYVKAMWLMLQQDEPDDYVIATNETHSVKEFAELAFSYVDLDWEEHVVVDEKLYRPADVHALRGDYSKGKRKLGWEPTVRFDELVKMMVEADLKNEKTLYRRAGG